MHHDIRENDLSMTEADWLEAFSCASNTLDNPFPETALRSVQSILDWTSENSTALVRAVGAELSYFQEQAPLTLFQALAWKKWRFADRKLARERKERSINGFLERNKRAASIPLPSSHTIDKMRELLSRWLPFAGVYPGHFGPGAVAERYSHARRWEVMTPYLADFVHSDVDSEKSDDLLLYNDGDVLFARDTCRLCAVPKDWNKDRLITVEPFSRSFLQQSVRTTLYESIHAGPLKGSALDVLYVDGAQSQRRLALRASATREMGTIDLSDASDNITAELVDAVMPPWVSCLLSRTRSNSCFDGRYTHPLHLYAGMGNATTFVVESLVFAAYASAISWRYGLRSWVTDVYGDDIIAPNAVCDALLDQNDAFFRINTAKSFYGKSCGLRESCGIYALNGEDVTPTRINGASQSYQGRCGLAEHIQTNWDSNVPYKVRYAYKLASRALATGAVENHRKRIPGFPSVSIAAFPFESTRPTRWNTNLQCTEMKVPVSQQECVRVTADAHLWAYAAALTGYVHTTPGPRGTSCVQFPLRGCFTPPRQRWRSVTP